MIMSHIFKGKCGSKYGNSRPCTPAWQEVA